MGFFSKVLKQKIRCDEQEYLLWKWHPKGNDDASASATYTIPSGSSLRVMDGEVAVFVYHQNGDSNQEFFEGPTDQTLMTEDGSQAEVYFINLQGNNQIKFAVPYFDVFDPRLPDHGVPLAVRGTITFNITDFKQFIKLNRLVNFDLEAFRKQIKDALIKYIKGVVMNVPNEMGIPLVQMETQILKINEEVEAYIKPRIENDFGVNLKGFDISALDINKMSPYYNELRVITADSTARIIQAETDAKIRSINDGNGTQSLNAKKGNTDFDINQVFGSHMYFCNLDGQPFGPVNIQQFSNMAKYGIVDGDTQVCRQGQSEWATAKDVPDMVEGLTNLKANL